jgi:hypothetical protein
MAAYANMHGNVSRDQTSYFWELARMLCQVADIVGILASSFSHRDIKCNVRATRCVNANLSDTIILVLN